MNPCFALLLSIFIILFIIRTKKSVTLAILIGSFVLGFLTIKEKTLTRFLITITSKDTLELIVLIVSAFILGFSMQEFGLFQNLSEKIEALTGKMSLIILPAIVGFLPMPGGALVSAIMIKDLVLKYQVDPVKATFINYWCRHLWVAVWPLYPSFILAKTITNAELLKIIEADYLITLAMIIMIFIFMKDFFKMRTKTSFNLNDLKSVISSLYPLILIIILSFFFHIKLLITIPCTIALLYFHKHPKPSQIKGILRNSLDPGILLLIIGVMFYKHLIIYTNSAQIFFEDLKMFHIPIPFAAFMLSFIIGFAVGIELGFSAIVFPLLLNFSGMGSFFNPLNFMLIFGGGLMGVMLSPLHLCLILTSKYYKADLVKVYKYLTPSVFLVSIILWIFYLLKISF
ncbi:DUF401 family protein [Thermodesulfobacterium hydrogeniphilum]|uniref:DUF401 family protein n=1 Tax=Thermodesulfobacterium hydrogeniphilum TaxID=161156 RepID=UPI0005707043|nr:DUF401 family protein [Thermodesulfobacterium hydrogeniphilum]